VEYRPDRDAKQDTRYNGAASDSDGRRHFNDSCAAFLRGPAPWAHTHAMLIANADHIMSSGSFKSLRSMKTPGDAGRIRASNCTFLVATQDADSSFIWNLRVKLSGNRAGYQMD
jgi:hypothetical protein